jgi:hypothetical protein
VRPWRLKTFRFLTGMWGFIFRYDGNMRSSLQLLLS